MDLVPSSITSSRQIEHEISAIDEESSFPRFPGKTVAESVDWLPIRRLLRSSSLLAPAISPTNLLARQIGGNPQEKKKKLSFRKMSNKNNHLRRSLSLSPNRSAFSKADVVIILSLILPLLKTRQ